MSKIYKALKKFNYKKKIPTTLLPKRERNDEQALVQTRSMDGYLAFKKVLVATYY